MRSFFVCNCRKAAQFMYRSGLDKQHKAFGGVNSQSLLLTRRVARLLIKIACLVKRIKFSLHLSQLALFGFSRICVSGG